MKEKRTEHLLGYADGRFAYKSGKRKIRSDANWVFSSDDKNIFICLLTTVFAAFKPKTDGWKITNIKKII